MELSLLNLLFVLLAAWVAGNLATRIGYPAVLGELIAGILLGPPLLGLLHGSEAIAVLAEVGVLLMMLYIGMEVDPRELQKVSWAGVLAAIGGFATPFVLAYLTVLWFGGTHLAGLFVGIAAGITSLATKSRILVDLKLLDTRVAHVMMAGALISDTLSLIIFAAILGVAEEGRFDVAEMGLVALRAVIFFGITILVGLKVFPYVGRRLSDAGMTGRTFNFTLVLLIAVLFGELAELAGLHAVLGAFIAGLFLRENVLGRTLSQSLMEAVRDASIGFLAPIFFVMAGFEVSFSVFQTNLGFFMAIMVVATVGKILGTALFYLPTGYGWREGIAIGAGMNGRGAVEIIVAGIALEMGLISQEIFSILVFMAIFTTAAVPLFLKWGTDWLQRRGELVRTAEERQGVLIIGAGALARTLAKVFGQAHPVWLLDTNRERCSLAKAEGFNVLCGNALQEHMLSEAHAAEADTVIAMTSNIEVNTLAAHLVRDVFFVPEVHVLQRGGNGIGYETAFRRLGATTLFAGPVALDAWDHWLSHEKTEQSKVRMAELEARTPRAIFEALQAEQHCLPLAIERDGKYVPFHTGSTFKDSDNLVVLCLKSQTEGGGVTLDRFDRLVTACPVLDLEKSMPVEEFFKQAAAMLSEEVAVDPEVLADLFLQREADFSSIIAPGLAVPHAVVEGSGQFHMLIARSRQGILFPREKEHAYAIFVLVRSPEERNFHLRALSAIAQIVQDASFEMKWLTAQGPEELRTIVLEAERKRYAETDLRA